MGQKISSFDIRNAKGWCDEHEGGRFVMHGGSDFDAGDDYYILYQRGDTEGIEVRAGQSVSDALKASRYTRDLDEGRI